MSYRMRPALATALAIAMLGAQAQARPAFIKVMLEHPTEAVGGPPADLLARLEARKVKSYSAFTVISVPEHRRHEIEGVAESAGFRATLQEDWDRIFMPGFTVDSRAPRFPPSGVLDEYPGGEGLYVIQFEAPLDAEWTEDISQAGLSYVSYLPYNAALVYGNEKNVAQLAAKPHVQWASLYHPAFRSQPADATTTDRPGRYVVQLVDAPASQETVEALRSASEGEVEAETYGRYINVTAMIAPEMLRELARDPRVVAIEHAPGPMLSGEREAVGATGSTVSTTEPYQDGTQPFKPAGDYRTWLSNRNPFLLGLLSSQLIAVADTGFSGGGSFPLHPDFASASITGKAYCGVDYSDGSGHGTLVAGFGAGNPAGSPMDFKGIQPFHYGMGLAPGAGIYSQRMNSAGTFCGSITTWAQDAINQKSFLGLNSVVQTHSHNDYAVVRVNGACAQVADGLYTTESQQYDFIVRDQGLPITVSAGNVCQYFLAADPTCQTPLPRPCPSRVLPPATAKNVLAVGAAESYRPGMAPPCDHNTLVSRQAEDYWASSFKRVAFTSRQGTADGRFKPDLVAPATMVSSTMRHNPILPFCKKPAPALPIDQGANALYSIDTGTSFAAPQAAGAMAVVNAYRQASFLPALSPAALKAVLVGSSVSLKGGINDLWNSTIAARPNAVQGFGRLNLAMALSSTPNQGVLDQASWPSFTGAGQLTSRVFTVHDPSKPTVIVLAWSDEPAAVQAPVTLVRDLNLEVNLADNCTIYVGNRLHSTTEYSLHNLLCGQKRPPDTKNNVEIIVIPPSSKTTFTAWIRAATWGGTVPQKFAVYYYNAFP